MTNKDLQQIKLTPKQEKFCQSFVKSGNKSEAYRSAYSTSNMKAETINKRAVELSNKGAVKGRITQLQTGIAERNKISIDECVQLLADMARFDVADLFNDNGTLKDFKVMSKEARSVIESIDVDEIKVDNQVIGHSKKVKLSSRRSNIIELMKHLGGYEKDNGQKSDIKISFKD
ncbi:terminase small subunit [Tenacibaculum finnmarkense genomovar finnmarkense]|uniref:terminase small subunit n=1 Tax=Tenacibaculum finnmarkense TaxID=2781243 RepID=UPI001EFC00FC|nr:terminase small subunit [Tenacibaculum finnmarkense]MCG8212941.1 terminase small subunit [Tenacibaculum finnmarkense genomovar finnmarkense]MCG8231188.1 terminase small subunit [Tenacibaculum finnmarkense genomovar finnmarkense]MCG8884597.1 terminase small subunit [Tenacibaculum finnmarkense]MCG8897177.1 terminase small subunit [Tenacibaculum finnmarkense]MCG8903216.1 terminase small subunit [Tenacibaculum finnmarkense]